MVHFQDISHQSHREQSRAVSNSGKGGYTVAVQNIYSVPPPSPKEHHKVIDNLNTTFQGMQTQSYELERLVQANEVLTSSNSAVMEQLAPMTVTMNAMQAQLKTFSSATTKTTMTKSKSYCWSCRINFTHGSKTCLAKKSVNK